jgi:hypothetical protein
MRPALTVRRRTLGGWPLSLQAEALALLGQLAPADHVPEGALELRLLTGMQVGEPEQFLDAEGLLGLGEVSPHVLKKVGHESSQRGGPGGP